MTGSSLPSPAQVYRYRAYGMTIEADRPVPRLTPADDGGEEPVRLVIGPVPPSLAQIETQDDFFQANDREYLYRHPGWWAILVRDGRHALFEAMGPLSEEQFWYSAVTNATAVAGFQRGMFPLHGSSVAFGSGVVAFTGPSGAGKTSMTAGLVLRGRPLVSDDLCLLRPTGDGYVSGRGAPEIRLLRDAADALGWNQADSIGYLPERDKFAFVHRQAEDTDLPIRAVVELAFGDGPPRLERLDGVAPLCVLVASIRLRMGLPLLPPSQRMTAFQRVSAMARVIPVYRFTRPRDYAQFAAGADLLIREFGE